MKSSPATLAETRVSAAEFKAKCLQLIDDAHGRQQGVVVTKRGVPMARLIPYEQAVKAFRSIVGRTPAIRIPPNFAELRAALASDWANPADKLIHSEHEGKQRKKKKR